MEIKPVGPVGSLPGTIAITLEPKEQGIMQEPPRPKTEPVINREMRILILVVSLFTGIVNVIVFLYYLNVRHDLELARSVVFSNVALDSLFYAFSVRSLRRTLFDASVFKNPWLFVAVLISFLLQLAGLYLPAMQRILGTVALGFGDWIVVLGVSTFVIVVFEFTKFLFRFFNKKPALL